MQRRNIKGIINSKPMYLLFKFIVFIILFIILLIILFIQWVLLYAYSKIKEIWLYFYSAMII